MLNLAIGASPAAVATLLHDLATRAENARTYPGPAFQRVDEYLRWANDAALRPPNQVAQEEIDRLVLTPVYFSLLTLTREPSPRVTEVVDRELAERLADLRAAKADLQSLEKRWHFSLNLVVADTSVFIEHPDKIKELDFRPLVGVRHEPVHLLVPILVVDELDGLKRASDEKKRWRAGYTLAVFERCVSTPGQVGELQAEDYSALDTWGFPKGKVTVEIVLDPPRHVRLPINDDELVDRAVALHVLAARPLTFLTYDTGQAMRARATPLQVKKLKKQEKPEVSAP